MWVNGIPETLGLERMTVGLLGSNPEMMAVCSPFNINCRNIL